MAFDTTQTKINAIEKTGRVLGTLRTVHAFAVELKAAVDLYTAGTDPTFNAAFNAVFSSAERSELATMINQLTALAITDWEANHTGALGL